MRIGYDVLGSTAANLNFTNPKKLSGINQQVVLPASQRIHTVRVGWKDGNGSASGVVKLCLYDEGNASTNKPMIPGTEVSISYNPATLGTGAKWLELTNLSIDISAHAGKTVSVGLAPPAAGTSSGIMVLMDSVDGAVRSNSGTNSTSFPNPYVVASTVANQAWSAYFETETINTVALDSVGPNPATNVQSLTAVISGNLAAGTVKLISGGLEVLQTVSSWSYNSQTNKTTVVSEITQGGIAFGNVTVRYESGAVTLNGSVMLTPIAGNIQVAIANPRTEPGYIFDQMEFGQVANVTHIEHTDSPNTVINAQGWIDQTIARNFQVRLRDGSDNTWEAFTTKRVLVTAVVTGAVAKAYVGQATAFARSHSEPVRARPVGVAMQMRQGIVTANLRAIARPAGVRCRTRVGVIAPPAAALPPVAVGASVVPEFIVSGSASVISRVEGDTYGVQVQFHSGGRALSLEGWRQFELVVDPERNPVDATTRVMQTFGLITDASKGKVYLPVSGSLAAGNYYFNARCITPRGDRVTFLKGVYEVQEGIP